MVKYLIPVWRFLIRNGWESVESSKKLEEVIGRLGIRSSKYQRYASDRSGSALAGELRKTYVTRPSFIRMKERDAKT